MHRLPFLGNAGALALMGSMALAACESTTAMSVTQDVATSLSIVVAGGDVQDAGLLILEVGDTISLSAVATNPLGLAVPSGTVTWLSSNTTVAEVDASGLVSAVGVGSAEIRASAGEAVSSLPTLVNDSTSF
jgi:uncharacterized protein YjdB